MSSWWAPGWPAWSRPRNWPTPAAGCSCSTRNRRRTSAARPSGRSAGCSWSTRPSSAGSASRTRSSWPGRTGWARAGFDRADDRSRLLAAPVGPGLRGLRRRREAVLAARPGPALVPAGRLGRARRPAGRRARQLGAALPRHLGHRARGGRPRSRAGSGRPRREGRVQFALPAPGRRADRRPTAPSTACAARSWSRASAARGHRSSRTETGEFELHAPAVLVTAGGIGANHDLVRQNWPARLGPAAGTDDLRRARARGRPDAGHHRAGRRPDRQPRPDVALHRGHPELGPDLAAARHPDPARAVLAVVRRPRPAVPGAELPRLRHPRHAAGHRPVRLRLLLVRADPADHREGVRALRLGAEPRPDRQGRQRLCSAGRGPGRPARSRRSSDHGADFVVGRHAARAGARA